MSDIDPEMLALAERVERFIATGDGAELDGLFASDVTIIENFAPYIFRGPEAAKEWRAGMLDHTRPLSDLAFAFGSHHDFSVTDTSAYFVLPITWTGKLRGRSRNWVVRPSSCGGKTGAGALPAMRGRSLRCDFSKV